jgi:hypothetical protein
MSTRSFVGIGPLEKFKGIYIHSDGYPGSRIPQLVAWLWKNGFDQFVEAIENSVSGGSSFDRSLDPDNLLDGAYDDTSLSHVQGKELALDQEYTYVVTSDKIEVYHYGQKMGVVNWKTDPTREVIKYIFDSGIQSWELDDGVYYIIGRAVYSESGF